MHLEKPCHARLDEIIDVVRAGLAPGFFTAAPNEKPATGNPYKDPVVNLNGPQTVTLPLALIAEQLKRRAIAETGKHLVEAWHLLKSKHPRLRSAKYSLNSCMAVVQRG